MPKSRPRSLLTMEDMGMGHDMSSMAGMNHDMSSMKGMDRYVFYDRQLKRSVNVWNEP
jgi:hypothetical protein